MQPSQKPYSQEYYYEDDPGYYNKDENGENSGEYQDYYANSYPEYPQYKYEEGVYEGEGNERPQEEFMQGYEVQGEGDEEGYSYIPQEYQDQQQKPYTYSMYKGEVPRNSGSNRSPPQVHGEYRTLQNQGNYTGKKQSHSYMFPRESLVSQRARYQGMGSVQADPTQDVNDKATEKKSKEKRHKDKKKMKHRDSKKSHHKSRDKSGSKTKRRSHVSHHVKHATSDFTTNHLSCSNPVPYPHMNCAVGANSCVNPHMNPMHGSPAVQTIQDQTGLMRHGLVQDRANSLYCQNMQSSIPFLHQNNTLGHCLQGNAMCQNPLSPSPANVVNQSLMHPSVAASVLQKEIRPQAMLQRQLIPKNITVPGVMDSEQFLTTSLPASNVILYQTVPQTQHIMNHIVPSSKPVIQTTMPFPHGLIQAGVPVPQQILYSVPSPTQQVTNIVSAPPKHIIHTNQFDHQPLLHTGSTNSQTILHSTLPSSEQMVHSVNPFSQPLLDSAGTSQQIFHPTASASQEMLHSIGSPSLSTVPLIDTSHQIVHSTGYPAQRVVHPSGWVTKQAVHTTGFPQQIIQSSGFSQPTIHSTQHPSHQIVQTTKHPSHEIVQSTAHPLPKIVQSTTHPSHEIVQSTTHPSHEIVQSTTHPSHEIVQSTTHPSHEIVQPMTHPSHEIIQSTTHPLHPIVQSTTHPSHEIVQPMTHPSHEIVQSTTHPLHPIVQSTTHPSHEIVQSTTHPSHEIVRSTTHPSHEIFHSTTHPSDGIVQSTTNPLHGNVQPTAHPLHPIVQSTTHPLHEIVQPTTHPLHQIVQSTTHPSHKIVQSTTHPSHEIVQPTTHPLHQIVQSTTHPSHKIVQSTTHPSQNIVKSTAYPLHQIVDSGPCKAQHIIHCNEPSMQQISHVEDIPTMKICQSSVPQISASSMEPYHQILHSTSHEFQERGPLSPSIGTVFNQNVEVPTMSLRATEEPGSHGCITVCNQCLPASKQVACSTQHLCCHVPPSSEQAIHKNIYCCHCAHHGGVISSHPFVQNLTKMHCGTMHRMVESHSPVLCNGKHTTIHSSAKAIDNTAPSCSTVYVENEPLQAKNRLHSVVTNMQHVNDFSSQSLLSVAEPVANCIKQNRKFSNVMVKSSVSGAEDSGSSRVCTPRRENKVCPNVSHRSNEEQERFATRSQRKHYSSLYEAQKFYNKSKQEMSERFIRSQPSSLDESASRNAEAVHSAEARSSFREKSSKNVTCIRVEDSNGGYTSMRCENMHQTSASCDVDSYGTMDEGNESYFVVRKECDYPVSNSTYVRLTPPRQVNKYPSKAFRRTFSSKCTGRYTKKPSPECYIVHSKPIADGEVNNRELQGRLVESYNEPVDSSCYECTPRYVRNTSVGPNKGLHKVIYDRIDPCGEKPKFETYVVHAACMPESLVQNDTLYSKKKELPKNNLAKSFSQERESVRSTSPHNKNSLQYSEQLKLFGDRLVDENLRLQRDIASLHRAINRGVEMDYDVSPLSIEQQNHLLQNQIGCLGKAIHDFAERLPDTDEAAKLIEELAYQFNVAIDDMNCMRRILRDKQLDNKREVNRFLKESAYSAKGVSEGTTGAESVSDHEKHIEQSHKHGSHMSFAKMIEPHEWYKSPLQADDIRHEMALVDDLIGQAQRIIAEATDNLWLVEYTVKMIMDKLFQAVGLHNGTFNNILKDAQKRQDYLINLKATIEKHLVDVFSTRATMDRIQEQIMHIKARSWNPNKNIPYCSCRPRRDILEEDVSHLMERLHEAGDQACEMRERLLGMELANLTLNIYNNEVPSNVTIGGVLRQKAQAKDESSECQRLREKVLLLEHQLAYAKTRNSPGASELNHRRKVSLESISSTRTTVSEQYNEQRSDTENSVIASRNNKYIEGQNWKSFRQEVLKRLSEFENTCLSIQKSFDKSKSDSYVEDISVSNIVSQLNDRINRLKKLINKMEVSVKKEVDPKSIQGLSLRIRNLIEEIAKESSASNISDRSRLSFETED